ncbi:MAG: hypothetical protein WAM60_19375 [Candidatus Promineifilaceae bacterium]
MKTKRTIVILAIIIAALSFLTVSMASAAGSGGLDCAALSNSALSEPEGYAEQCMGNVDTIPWATNSVPTDTAYALDIRNDNFVSHVLNDFAGQTILGINTGAIYAMDFDETATTLYAIDNTTRELGTLSLANGAFSSVAVVSGVPITDNISGLTIDPSTGTAYISGLGSAGMTLYTLDLSGAVATPIGSDASVPLLIDIAMNCDGEMYGHDIGTDMIYTINTSTGAVTAVGPTGVNSNFAQGMDFDNDDGTLYAYTYQGGGANQYGTINLATGALTPLSVSNPLGEFEGGTQTVCGASVNPAVEISKTPATQDVVMNGNANFTITVTNTGDVDLVNVNVSDPQVSDCDNAIGTLSVGASNSYSCVDTGVTASYTNVATVTTELPIPSDGAGPSASASAVVNVVPPTSVSLTGFGGDAAAFSPIWLAAVLAVVLGLGFVIRRKITA